MIQMITEIRGEASRLEVEAAAGTRRAELLEQHTVELRRELETAERRCKELEARAEECTVKESVYYIYFIY